LPVATEGELAVLIVLLLLTAFFAGSEVGFLAIGRARARHLAEAGSPSARLLLRLHHRRNYWLAATLTVITGGNYLAERIATLLSVNTIGPRLGPIVAFAGMTVIVLVFCEIIPVRLANHRPARAALTGVWAIACFGTLLAPVVALLSVIARGLLYTIGVRRGGILPTVTEDEIKAMIQESEAQGGMEPVQTRMLHGVLDFGDQTAAQVMTPRTDMVCVGADQALAEALDIGLEHKHSRLPVYEGTLDNILGVLHLKDLLPHARRGSLDTPVRQVARPASHVPESLPASDLLRELQRRHRMVAIVRDEFGGTAGLVTVEDLLEEIVGEIRDEYDEVETPEVEEISEDEWLCEGRASLFALQNYVAQDLPAEDYDSLAGWLVDLAGKIPEVGDEVRAGQLTLRVEAMSGTRVERVRVTQETVE
jgi:putative hemolysin